MTVNITDSRLSCNYKVNIEDFVTTQLKLLEIERDAEIEENKCLQEGLSLKSLQKKGLCVPKLRCANISAGLFGRMIVKLIPSYGLVTLPAHVISSGDIVGIGNFNADGKFAVDASGVVSSVHESYITIALEKNLESSDLDCDEIYCVMKLANDVTYKRLKRILKTLQSEAEKVPLTSVLFGYKNPSKLEYFLTDNIKFYNQNLNDAQKDAVTFALGQKDIAILHGPPGTGKTTTLVECILQTVAQKLKVIVCAPSNIAVDNLVEKIAPYKFKLVRLGHPARVLTDIQKYSLDAIVSQYEGSDVIDDMQQEIAKVKSKIENTKHSGTRKKYWAENRNLLQEMKKRQKSIMIQILTNADIILCTLTSASFDGPLKHVGNNHFDVCFIDECSQALEIACWIPLALVKKCVIAGDHNQLPPTIISEKAAKGGFTLTLMERLLKLYGESIKKMLTVQYRMHEIIMQWPSKQLYDNKLKAHETVHSHLLSDLPGVETNDDTTIPLLLIDTTGCDLYELEAEDEASKGNEGEADLVFIHIETLIKSGIHPSDIAVITPYNLQVDLIKSRCSAKFKKLEIKSVDGFQGREKEAVILSLVRSNDDGDVGFLSEDRRINVAITRAKRHLAVICNSSTVSHSDFLKSFIDYCEEVGEVRSAFQYKNEIEHYPIAVKQKPKNKQPCTKPQKKQPTKSTLASTSKDPIKKQQNTLVDEVERFDIEEKLRQIIKDFIESPSISFSFSPELSAFERKVVHEISEELGLQHVSQGEKQERYIVVSKKPAKDVCILNPVKDVQENIAKVSIEDSSKIEENPGIKEDVKDPDHINAYPGSSDSQKSKTTKVQKSNKKQSKNKISVQSDSGKQAEDDFDALIAATIKADRTCCFEDCKKCVAVLSQVCQFCKGRFCFSHFIPEAHGCGQLAKQHARSQIRKEGKIYPGSGKPVKKVDPLKQSYLQKKLKEKISTMTNQRKKQKNVDDDDES